jgi:hypothetical protein
MQAGRHERAEPSTYRARRAICLSRSKRLADPPLASRTGSAEVEDHDAALRGVVLALGLRRWTISVDREFEARVLVFSPTPLLLLSTPDLFDDERREHSGLSLSRVRIDP